MSATARTRIKARLLPRFPATINAGTMLAVERVGTGLTLRFTMQDLSDAAAPEPVWRLPIYDPAENVYRSVELETLAATGSVSLAQISDMSDAARGLNAALDTAAMRSALGAAASVHTHTLAQVSDMSVAARTVNAAVDVTAMRGALGAAASAHSHSASQITDSQTFGRTMLGTATSADGTALLDAFTASTKGLVPAAGGGTAAFLRADGAWATPPGTAGTPLYAGFINNLQLAANVTSNALTIAMKTGAGTDPSGTDTVTLVFPSASESSGAIVSRNVTTATSLTITSGSTLGSGSGVAFRLWIVAFDDAGTVRIGVINCRDSSLNIYALSGTGIASSSAEGGGGGADSAHVFYTNTAITAKSYIILGYVEYSSGLAAAGVYVGAPTRIRIHRPGLRLPGDLVQRFRGTTGATVSGTTVTPSDDSIPQITEGDQYMTQSITPTSSANVLINKAQWIGAHSVGGGTRLIVALHEDSVSNALAATWSPMTGANEPTAAMIEFHQIAATTNPTTKRIRAGCPAAGTTIFNGNGSGRLLGGAMNSYLEVSEVMA